MDSINDPPTPGSITFLTGSLTGKTYQVGPAGASIGREPGNTIVIADASVSRRHAQIVWNNGAWTISKLAPQNRLIVNQQDVQQSVLHEQDIVGLGGEISFRFQLENGSAMQRTPAPNQTIHA